MNLDQTGDRAAALRRAFDSAFAEPIVTETHLSIDFISIRLGEDAHAIRMTEIASLFSELTIVPCPSPLPELLGLAGFRGVLTPVYDLAALLGYPPASGRWIVLESSGALAFAFDDFEDHFRIAVADVAARQSSTAVRHVAEIARQDDRSWPVIDIPSVVAAIRDRATAALSQKEY